MKAQNTARTCEFLAPENESRSRLLLLRNEPGEGVFAYMREEGLSRSKVNFIDPAGLDAITDNPRISRVFYCLFWRTIAPPERGREHGTYVIIGEGDNIRVGNIFVGDRTHVETTIPNPQTLPDGQQLIVAHTHPSNPRPSTQDVQNADRLNINSYVISRSGIVRIDPEGRRTQEEGPGWYEGYDCDCPYSGSMNNIQCDSCPGE